MPIPCVCIQKEVEQEHAKAYSSQDSRLMDFLVSTGNNNACSIFSLCSRDRGSCKRDLVRKCDPRQVAGRRVHLLTTLFNWVPLL